MGTVVPTPDQSFERENLLLLYDTAHSWVKHYQTLIMQLNAWVMTFNGAILTFILTSYFRTPQPPANMFLSLLAPIGMSATVIIATRSLDRAMRGGFRRMVQIEDALGLFGLKTRDGTPLLGEQLRQSPSLPWAQVVVWWVVNGALILVCVMLFTYFQLSDAPPRRN